MDRAELSRIAHLDHPIAAPLAEDRVRRLVGLLSVPDGGTVLDLGCGFGAWLLAALEAHPGVRGVGVDLSRPALEEAGARAQALGLSGRVEWVEADGAAWSGAPVDAVLCVGASHAFGGLEGTLAAVRSHLAPGGQVVLGDGIWDEPPSRAAQEALDAGPDDFPDLAGLVARVRAGGFEVVQGHVSTREEWDDYEWSWTGSLVRWALEQPAESAARAEALVAAREHRDGWLTGYRGQLGFASLVLVDVEPAGR